MPIPLLLIVGAAIAGTAGVASGAVGAKKIYDANGKMEEAKKRHNSNLSRFKKQNDKTTKMMDDLGKQELEIISGFDEFSDLIEKIQNRPSFKEISVGGLSLPKFNSKELKDAGIGAGVLLGGLGGAAAGTAGGVAAAGATTAAVMALGTASTGTAISALSGAAASNAALAALGGGSLAAGGGGMALGATVLSGATLGVGLLIGGVIFNVVGGKVSDKADEAYKQMVNSEREINRCCCYLNELYGLANIFSVSLSEVTKIYKKYLSKLDIIINDGGKTDWDEFTDGEKNATETAVLLVQLLFNMCKTKLVKQDKDGDGYNELQKNEVHEVLDKTDDALIMKGLK